MLIELLGMMYFFVVVFFIVEFVALCYFYPLYAIVGLLLYIVYAVESADPYSSYQVQQRTVLRRILRHSQKFIAKMQNRCRLRVAKVGYTHYWKSAGMSLRRIEVKNERNWLRWDRTRTALAIISKLPPECRELVLHAYFADETLVSPPPCFFPDRIKPHEDHEISMLLDPFSNIGPGLRREAIAAYYDQITYPLWPYTYRRFKNSEFDEILPLLRRIKVALS